MTDRCLIGALPAASRREALVQLAQGAGGIVLALAGCSEPASSQAARMQPKPGESDDALLARLVAAGGRAHLPHRGQPYRLTRTIRLVAGTTLTLDPDTRLIWEGPRGDANTIVGVFEAMGDAVAIQVEGGEAIVSSATSAPFVYAARMRGHEGFTVVGLNGENIQHVHISAATDDFARIRMGGSGVNVARNVHIAGGGTRHTTPQTVGHGSCMLSYVFGATLRNANYHNVSHGVEWWGGNADPTRPPAEGGVNTERKCRDLIIQNVTVRNARGGGIWGSMGRDVIVRDCLVDTAHDVAFDAEGSNNVLFERCTARNGHNGCFATFFLCNGVRFADCRGTVTDKAFPLVRIYNNTLSNAGNKAITVAGGSFECLDRSGPSTIDTAMGPVQDFTITGATLRNVRIDTAFHNMHRTRIVRNTLDFPYPLSSVAAIRAGASKTLATAEGMVPGSTLIEGNRIRLSSGTQGPGRASAIQLREDDYNGSATGIIRGNQVSGAFATGIALVNATANTGIVPSFELEANQFTGMAASARTVTISQSGRQARRPIVRWGRGHTRDGKDVSANDVLS